MFDLKIKSALELDRDFPNYKILKDDLLKILLSGERSFY